MKVYVLVAMKELDDRSYLSRQEDYRGDTEVVVTVYSSRGKALAALSLLKTPNVIWANIEEREVI